VACVVATLLLLAPPATAQQQADLPNPYSLRVLEDHEGQATSLGRAAAGHRLVVVVMKSVECPVCRGQLQRLRARAEQLARLGATVVGLSHDGAVAADGDRTGPFGDFAVLLDRNREVLRALRLWRPTWRHPVPTLLVFDMCGAERARLEGRAPGMHPEEALFRVLAELAEKPCGTKLAAARLQFQNGRFPGSGRGRATPGTSLTELRSRERR
jgi:peroxiredoxin